MPSPLMIHTISVSRLSDGAGGKRTLASVASGVRCFIEPVDEETAQAVGGAIGKTFNCFTDLDDLQVGDKVTDQDSSVYVVKGFARYPKAGGVAHSKALMEIDNG